jgi:tetratricopeptide (TPR) repeat protein
MGRKKMPTPSDLPGKPSNDFSHFVGRETERNIFLRYLGLPIGAVPRLPVLMFLGIGGAGKTWLLKYLQSQISGPFSTVPCVRIDFTREGASNLFRDDPSAVLSVVRMIAKNDPCPRFDIAYAYLRVLRGVADKSKLVKKGRKTAWDVTREVLKAGLSDTPHGKMLGFAWTIVEKIYPSLPQTEIAQRLAILLEQDYEDLKAQTIDEIEASLVSRLASDLKTAHSLYLHPLRAVNGVVFVDTVEAVDDPAASPFALASRTLYLRDLIAYLNDRILFVLAGQNRLRWSELDEDWDDPRWLEQHLLNGLSEFDSRKYLDANGITDAGIQTAMLSVCLHDETSYHPFHLGLLTDLAWIETHSNNKALTRELFQELPRADWGALVLRFFRSIQNRVDSDWITKLAITPEFDENAARAAYSSSTSQAQDTAWQMLRMFSFLSNGHFGGGWHTIHSEVRRAILQHSLVKAETLRKMHEWWNLYWSGRSEATVELELAWHHLYMVSPQQALPVWAGIANRALWSSPPNTIIHAELVSWWDTIDLLSQISWTDSDMQAAFLFSAGLRRMAIGDRETHLRKAIALNERCFAVIRAEHGAGLLAENHIALAESYACLPSGDTNNHIQQAVEHLTSALEITSADVFPETWAHAHNAFALALGNLPFRRKKTLHEALDHANEVVRSWTREDKPSLWAFAQITFGMLYQKLGEGGDKAAADLSVKHYQAALELGTQHLTQQQWAEAETGLCSSYHLVSVGKRSVEDAENAYHHGVAALRIWTRHTFPEQYAVTQKAIGNILFWLSSGDRSDFVLGAIRSYEAASDASSREVYPNLWARIQGNLGAAYTKLDELTGGGQWVNAVKCIDASSNILTELTFPYDYALNQSRLGRAMLLRRDTAYQANLAAAKECYKEALRFWSREDFPEEWAAVHRSLGDAYGPLNPASPKEHLERAIEQYETALAVKTRAGFPVDHAELCVLLTGPLVYLAMQLVDTPDRERSCMARALNYYRDAVQTVSVQCWFGGVLKGAETMGKLFCEMFAREMLTTFEHEFRQLDPLLESKHPTVSEASINSTITRILDIVDIWIKRLNDEGKGMPALSEEFPGKTGPET